MTITHRLKYTIPFVLLFLLFGLLGHELYSASSSHISSSMTGEPLPRFRLPNLYSPKTTFSSSSIRGHVALLNVFASWCSACNAEHPMMMRIKNEYHVPIYGVLYRDQASDAIDWLKNNGNPYTAIGYDENGSTGVELGIYGTPETFVISPEGKILYRHVGVITQSVWDDDIYPIIQKYEH